MKSDYNFAGLYDLRLKLSQHSNLVHINEYLYSEVENDTRKSGEKIFDYVDPKNRDRQIEMEQACTEHLKEIGDIWHRSSRRLSSLPVTLSMKLRSSFRCATVSVPSAMPSSRY